MTDLLLPNDTARRLYESVKALPVIDYHNHLSLTDILENRRFTDIYDLWIAPDPYKHRAMRMCGVPESHITGDAPAREKFRAWCAVYPRLIGNPLYVWTQMELQSVPEIGDRPSADNADALYEKANRYLAAHEVTPAALFSHFRAERVCPCVSFRDDPASFREHPVVKPSLRADDLLVPDEKTVRALEKLTCPIRGLEDYRAALAQRVRDLSRAGVLFADHALDDGFRFAKDDGENGRRFETLLRGEPLNAAEKSKLSAFLLTFLLCEYAANGMTVQLHLGAARHTSTRLRTLAGAQGGFAAVGSVDTASLTALFDSVERQRGLPKMILFPLDPADNARLAVLAGSFASDHVPGLITNGPAWWWCDHEYGIRQALEAAASFGLLAAFCGMTTDSRSFLSFVRHDYFRRVLCAFFAEKLERKALGCAEDDVKPLLYAMCYGNAKQLLETGKIFQA